MDPSTSRAGRYVQQTDPFSENFDAEYALENIEISPRSDDLDFTSVELYEQFLMEQEPDTTQGILELDKEEAERIFDKERRVKGRKRREQALAEVVRKGNELKKAEAIAKGESAEIKREKKKNKDVNTKMEAMEGPLARLREYRNRQRKVMVVLRSDSGVNRVMTAQILAFDKHWNLVLRNVHETYLPAKRLGKVQSLRGQMPCAVRYDQVSGGGWRYAVEESKRHVLERRQNLLFVMGDSVVLVSNPNCPTMKVAGNEEMNFQMALAEDIPWRTSVRGFLLDVTGVLYNSGGGRDLGEAIPGSIEAVRRLYAGSSVRFLSNESSSTRAELHAKLTKLGFDIKIEHLITPAPVCAKYLNRESLRPHLLLAGVETEFVGCHMVDPNCVVMGDAEEGFTYDALNKAFRVLHGMKDPLLISLGCGKFYQRTDGPCLDLGGFAKGLVFATEARHSVIGKPSTEYFTIALEEMGLNRESVVMIGDDIVSDVGGAQKQGIKAVQVRTGKWKEEWANHGSVRPDLVADNLSAAVSAILG
ncbi:hypothetical protein QR680_017445 [Steinernema hermaphroditum]|uniref:Phospholysine phosphohistidine inorganic pyrophosphate phosphatase n=1 Tax=Steinernema hermaphroditum TaxID=289476 RepID=A0AA39LP12_9BILA|nr:hypothetical protein QR680_017445 [Steinernema hermaphroditum]